VLEVREFKKYSNVFELFEEIGFHHSEEEKAFIEAMSQIGGQLMAYRKKHNLTQKDLAKKLGISQSMVSKIETGEKNISIRVLTKIVAAFGGRVRISLGILPEEEENKVPEYKFREAFPNDIPYTSFETQGSVAA
jgi:transcriptional regulator with XRE-family HTH domain